jgi:hypothetical protein
MVDLFPRGFDEHRRAQARMGLRMTPAERLRWLEETMETLRRWQGRARKEDPRNTVIDDPRRRFGPGR